MKTIRLKGDIYNINEDGDVLKFVETKPEIYDYESGKKNIDYEYGYIKTKYKIGRECVLVSRTDVSVNSIRSGNSKPYYYLSFDLDGVSGNSNRNIKKTSGWRGTTNNQSIDAYGIYTITNMKKLKNGDISVTVKKIKGEKK